MADIVFAGETSGGPLNADALPQNYDLVLYKGDYVRLNVLVRDAQGVPVSMVGATPKAQLKSDYTDRDPKEFTCSVDFQAEGLIELYLPSSITSLLLPGSYIYDFQVTYENGDTRTYLAGDVTVINEVTA